MENFKDMEINLSYIDDLIDVKNNLLKITAEKIMKTVMSDAVSNCVNRLYTDLTCTISDNENIKFKCADFEITMLFNDYKCTYDIKTFGIETDIRQDYLPTYENLDVDNLIDRATTIIGKTGIMFQSIRDMTPQIMSIYKEAINTKIIIHHSELTEHVISRESSDVEDNDSCYPVAGLN